MKLLEQRAYRLAYSYIGFEQLPPTKPEFFLASSLYRPWDMSVMLTRTINNLKLKVQERRNQLPCHGFWVTESFSRMSSLGISTHCPHRLSKIKVSHYHSTHLLLERKDVEKMATFMKILAINRLGKDWAHNSTHATTSSVFRNTSMDIKMNGIRVPWKLTGLWKSLKKIWLVLDMKGEWENVRNTLVTAEANTGSPWG